MNDTVNKVANIKGNPNPVDPDVKIPAAVLRAAAAAEAAQRAAYPDQAPVTPDAPPPTNADGITIAPPPATPPTPEPPQPQPHASVPQVTPPGNEPPAPDAWEQKFRSAEGRRIKAENERAQMADRLAMLEGTVEELQRRATAAPATPPTPPKRLITEQEENEFGAEMLDVMARRAQEAISPELAELRRMMQEVSQKVEGTSTAIVRNARADMLSKLDSAMPEWRQVNENDGFKAWLALQDPLFGASRHSALLKAYEQNDTARVLAFFKSFISELAATSPADVTTQDPPATPPARTPLADLAAPGRARTSAQTNAPTEKQIITTADIDAFYAAVRQGKYAGRESEKAALEQELFAAQREGRVRAA